MSNISDTPPLTEKISKSNLETKILALIQQNGILTRTLKGFEPRLAQQEMMTEVIQAYNQEQIALIEAGTGTGKSLAYLLPALIWAVQFQERTIISTNTITLQEQLVKKDIPQLLHSLNIEIKVALMKGMNHYVCLRKLEDTQSEYSLFSHDNKQEIEGIAKWCETTTSGSRSEIPQTISASSWERISAENEACLHHECPYYQQCFFFKARRQAQEAQIVVVNHHLLFADLMKRADHQNYSETCILPTYKRLIIDEAHHIEDIATEYFATRIHRIELMHILARISAEKTLSSPGKLSLLKEKIQSSCQPNFSKEIQQILALLTIDLPASRHDLIEKIHHTFDIYAAFTTQQKNVLQEDSTGCEHKLRLLQEHQQHCKWKEEIVPATQQLIHLLSSYHQNISSLESDLQLVPHEKLHEQTKNIRIDIQALLIRIQTVIHRLSHFISPFCTITKVRWIETQALRSLINVHLVDAELDISKALADFLFSKFSTIILCSATLTTNNNFSFVRHRLGLTPQLLDRVVTESIYPSPFDYRAQVMLAVPTDMPPPNHPDFNEIAYENIWQAIQASHGQIFVLFTSYNMLQNCYQALAKRLEENHYPIFKPGDTSRQALLDKFKNTKRAVLFGTDSFWEGVDVIGDALRCVIIVKLHFKVPNEPIIQARAERILSNGGNPFMEDAVPQAIVKFKQGFGRLIRHKWDRGCIICLDTRLISKGYGKLFLNSLPPCKYAFMNGPQLWPILSKFYLETYHFVKKNPFSIS
jgi:ATP-dependent DNA helicase DinG